MSITLEALVDQLQEAIPARDGVPSEDGYERMVKEAVRDFSRRCGRVKRANLSITAGTATYELAADFLKMIAMADLMTPEGLLHSATGHLVAVPDTFQEEATINGREITFHPTPTYSMTRAYRYKAGWVLSEDDYLNVYATMGDEEAGIVLLKAEALALDSLWRSNAGNNFKFQIGDESYDMSGSGNDLENSRKAAESAYVEACAQYNGNTGRML